MSFNPFKVIDRIKSLASIIQESLIIRGFMFIKLITFFKESVLTSSSLNTEKICSANAALLSEISTSDHLSTLTQTYATYVVKRSERVNIRNMIIAKK